MMPRVLGKFDAVVFVWVCHDIMVFGYYGVIERVFHDAMIARTFDAMVDIGFPMKICLIWHHFKSYIIGGSDYAIVCYGPWGKLSRNYWLLSSYYRK